MPVDSKGRQYDGWAVKCQRFGIIFADTVQRTRKQVIQNDEAMFGEDWEYIKRNSAVKIVKVRIVEVEDE